ncbi:MAG TPA: hypothetical protein VHW45_03335 [Candidatus Sulfotelmatobacter sp.]|jgi:hypothetical protein|nr:hypothetical protein [Candidatus Sulfotelmatobacter sp.]
MNTGDFATLWTLPNRPDGLGILRVARLEGTPSYVILNGGEAGVKDPTSA